MHILVINCGSSSIKAAVIDSESGQRLRSGTVDRVGDSQASMQIDKQPPVPCGAGDHGDALTTLLPKLGAGFAIAGVGHRVVHGAQEFSAPTLISEAVEATIEELAPLAPLHNPVNLRGIRAARALFPDVPHVAVFDTALYATLPARARDYALPSEVCDEHKIRRYGFHGTSHEYVAKRAAAFLGEPLSRLRVITCHLGGGCSVTAMEHGRAVETSMGMTPVEGLVMGTRSGDVDPGALVHLMRQGYDADALDELLNRRSGLAGLSGVGRDMRDIEERAGQGDENCRRAIRVFCHRVRKYIGAYAAVMGGVDVIVMTAGIGQNSSLVRHRVLSRLDYLGARVAEEKNRDAQTSADEPVVRFSTEHSRVSLLIVATDEERAIAEHTANVVAKRDRPETPGAIPIAVSARHIHLTRESVETLFGKGHTLTPRSELSQPGQFACEETLTVVGPKRSIERVRVLGPIRGKNQIEVSRTDEFYLGIDAPVRRSGDVKSSPGITLVGPAGTLDLEEGVICAWRHIHMTNKDAERFGVKDQDIVEVAVRGGPRDLTFGDVMVRVSDKYALEMHIDTDEANAAELNTGAEGLLEATGGTAELVRRKI